MYKKVKYFFQCHPTNTGILKTSVHVLPAVVLKKFDLITYFIMVFFLNKSWHTVKTTTCIRIRVFYIINAKKHQLKGTDINPSVKYLPFF